MSTTTSSSSTGKKDDTMTKKETTENGATADENNAPPGHIMIEEGQAKMIYRTNTDTTPSPDSTTTPDATNNKESKEEEEAETINQKQHEQQQEVFYNPVQVQNRDLSILMVSLHAERRAKRRIETKLYKEKRKEIIASGTKKCHEITRNTMDISNEWKQEVGEHPKWSDKLEETSATDGIRILDALAASGLRSIRYTKEIPGVKEIIVNDLDPAAVEQAHDNVKFNKVDANVVKPQQGDATMVMYANRGDGKGHGIGEQFDVIDLDPYGSAAPFLDGAVQAVVDGGMLCVTCTDMAVLSGGHPETCYGRYNAMPMPKGKYLHELALRILLQTIATSAAKYGRTIKPILSVGMAFYIRVFVEVNNDKAGVTKLATRIGHVFQSTQCPSFYTVPQGELKGNVLQPTRGPPLVGLGGKCEETGGPLKMAGPVWLGPIHDFDVVDEAVERLETDQTKFPLPTKTPLHGLLTAVSEELSDVPLYYLLPDICHTLSCQMPPMSSIKAALMNAGYRTSAQHKEPNAIKTDAPNHVVWDIMRAWVKEHPIVDNSKNRQKKKTKKKKNKQGVAAAAGDEHETNTFVSPSTKILAATPKIEVDFTMPEGFDKKRKKAQRYPMNPEANWGPKPRATGKRKAVETLESEKDKDAKKVEE